MIPLIGMKTELEKSAGKTGDMIFKGKHPKATVGIIGGGAVAVAAGNKLHGLYHIVNEERKRSIMQRDSGVLRNILSEQIKGNKLMTPPPPPRYKRKTAPLS